LVLQFARQNPGWGYDRIVGALANLGYHISDQTVGNILKRHGLGIAVGGQNDVCFCLPQVDVATGFGWVTGLGASRRPWGSIGLP
jgi:hypothetical protein